MARFTLKVSGTPKVIKEMTRIPKLVREGTIMGLEQGGTIVLNTARQSILSGPRSGHFYKRYRPSRLHIASAPGEPPASDTGALARSLYMRVDKRALEVFISAGTKYAKWLEYGTKRMLARPFLRPALTKTRSLVSKTIADAIRKVLKK